MCQLGEYTELKNQIKEIRKEINVELVGLNETYTYLRSLYLQLIAIETEIVQIHSMMIDFLDKIDTTAMDAYNDDLHLDYLTGEI